MLKHQKVDMGHLIKSLRKMPHDCVRHEYLKKLYPSLFIFVLTKKGLIEELENFMKQCEGFKDDPRRYTHYVLGFLLPHFENMRHNGLLIGGLIEPE